MTNLTQRLVSDNNLLKQTAWVKRTARLGTFMQTLSFMVEMSHTIVSMVKKGNRLAFVDPAGDITYVESETLHRILTQKGRGNG